ncbi:AraC family transcriptional regulator [Bradyrhizobium sp. STM 3557]|uniref:helix-turn-helix transcriptional regulator n=1 Tax=Bradyrhizobium sp. STM 3557 TaxID=578920 RepID=UPI00388EE852
MCKDAAEFESHQFSTRDLPERMRLPLWRDYFGQGLVRAEIELLSKSPFQADATLQAIRGLRRLALRGSSMRFMRLRANLADGDDSIGIIVCSPGKCQLSQRGRDIDLRTGDAAAFLHSDIASVTYIDGSLLGLVVPREALAERVTNVERLTMRPVPHRTEALRLLMAYLKSTFNESVLAAPELRDAVVAHIHDLVAIAISACVPLGESSTSAVVAARHSAVLDYIATHFQEPELSVQMVARCQGISPRYLQRLIASSGSSFTGYVNELRLQQALRLLTESGDSTQRISDIALQVGFSDVSHFNRLFRARFGDSPRNVRYTRKDSC